jgi:hypothetical protein
VKFRSQSSAVVRPDLPEKTQQNYLNDAERDFIVYGITGSWYWIKKLPRIQPASEEGRQVSITRSVEISLRRAFKSSLTQPIKAFASIALLPGYENCWDLEGTVRRSHPSKGGLASLDVVRATAPRITPL